MRRLVSPMFRKPLSLGLCAMASLAAVALPLHAGSGGRPLATDLTGAAEAPGPGDPDGSGSALITGNPGQGRICFDIEVQDIALPATGAHIHVAPAGVAGPVVVPLTPPDATGAAVGCVEGVDRQLVKAILQHPEDYYVNVHTTEYPAGAVRGQLAK